MDVCLSDYGHCNNVSPKHACIFYDEVTARFILCICILILVMLDTNIRPDIELISMFE